MAEDGVDESSREGPLEQVLAEYLQAVDAGREPDRAEFLARYPQFAGELKEFFEDRAVFERAARPWVPLAGNGSTGEAAKLAGSTAVAAGTHLPYFGDYELLEEIARGGMGIVYKARQISLNRIVTNANLTNANLASYYYYAWANANLTNADLRGANTAGISNSGAIFNNTINTGGSVNGLHLTAAAPLMTIHNYHAPQGSTYTGAIHVSGELALDPGTTLQMIFDSPQWNSTISFDAGIPITLTGGILDLEVDPSVDPASLVGDTFQLFNFTGVTPGGQFTVTTDLPAGQFQWDTSQLYSDGIVTLDAVPEPTSASLLVIGSLALLRRRVRRSNVQSARLGS